MDTFTIAKAPLGPVVEHVKWYRQRASQTGGEGPVAYVTYTDRLGREYTSVEHVAYNAVREALEQ